MTRLSGLDIARFLAFAGMVLVNFRVAAEVVPGPDIYSTVTDALEGRAAALFVILAGIGLSLSTPVPARILSRAAILFGFGMANMIIFDADILHYYALYFLVGLALIRTPKAGLLVASMAIILAGLVALIAFDYERGWNWDTLHYADFWTLPGFLRHSIYNGWHPVVPWAAFFVIGMWLGRCDLSARRVQIRMAIGGAIGAITVTLIAALVQAIPEIGDLALLSPIPPGPFYMLAASASAIAVLGAVLLVTPSLTRFGVEAALARTGRQALTLYIAHIYVGMGLLEAFGWLDGSLPPAAIFWLAVLFVVASIFYAWAWAFVAKHGPLEALLRALTPSKPLPRR